MEEVVATASAQSLERVEQFQIVSAVQDELGVFFAEVAAFALPVIGYGHQLFLGPDSGESREYAQSVFRGMGMTVREQCRNLKDAETFFCDLCAGAGTAVSSVPSASTDGRDIRLRREATRQGRTSDLSHMAGCRTARRRIGHEGASRLSIPRQGVQETIRSTRMGRRGPRARPGNLTTPAPAVNRGFPHPRPVVKE